MQKPAKTKTAMAVIKVKNLTINRGLPTYRTEPVLFFEESVIRPIFSPPTSQGGVEVLPTLLNLSFSHFHRPERHGRCGGDCSPRNLLRSVPARPGTAAPPLRGGVLGRRFLHPAY